MAHNFLVFSDVRNSDAITFKWTVFVLMFYCVLTIYYHLLCIICHVLYDDVLICVLSALIVEMMMMSVDCKQMLRVLSAEPGML